jgi:hypothetical protein
MRGKMKMGLHSGDHLGTTTCQNRPNLSVYACFGVVWFGSGN